MSRRKMTRGNCVYCGRDFTRSGMAKHLTACPARQETWATAEKSRLKSQPLYHLQIQDAYGGDYWLHLEVNGSATLDKLDDYLRTIWLECCGHLSSFDIEGLRYTQIFDDGFGFDEDRPMNKAKAAQILHVGATYNYEYDFGSTTELKIIVQAVREGKPTTKHPIALMSRNIAPAMMCVEKGCDQPATHICVYCLYETETGGALCTKHGRAHDRKHGDDYGGSLTIYNSPRTGVCAYDGPAKPPY
jgi:hypothetical protein